MSKKSTNPAAPIPSGDPPSDPSRLDLLENKLDRVLNAISTLSTKLDAHISKSSDDIQELSAASTGNLRSLESRMDDLIANTQTQLQDLTTSTNSRLQVETANMAKAIVALSVDVSDVETRQSILDDRAQTMVPDSIISEFQKQMESARSLVTSQNQAYLEALPKPPRPTDLPPLSPHTPDALAQTITNCTYPNAPLLSHHPTHVVSWFRQSILRKTKLTTTSKTFHYDAMRKFSPEVFLTLRDMARIHFNSIDFRFPTDDDAFYAAILTTIFWDKNYENLLSLFQSAVPQTSDQFSNHIFVCGVRSIITILPEHLSQYDIKHIISAVRKFLTPPLQLLFDGYCTTITSLDHIVPALLRSLAASHANHTRSSNPVTQSLLDRSDRPYQQYHSDRNVPREHRDPRPTEPLQKIPDSDRTGDAPRQRRLNNVAMAHHPNTVVLDPSTFVSICEHCNARNDHDTFECPHPCQSMECSSKLVLPHAHKDCPWFGAEFDQF